MDGEIRITSKDNAAIKHYRQLCERKRVRKREKLFVAEGLRIVCDALQYPECAGTVFITDTAWEKYGTDLRSRGAHMIRISDEVGDSMAETEHTQGIFAVCRLPEMKLADNVVRQDGRYLVLCDLQDPGNMGTILRTADALGMDAVLLCRSCEPYSPKVVRATMGALFRIPVYEESDERTIAEILHEKGIRSFAAVLDDTAVSVTECGLGKGCAVWIGNEGSGLSEEAAAVCEQHVIIPMQGQAESLNAAMAAGILMWEMMKTGGGINE